MKLDPLIEVYGDKKFRDKNCPSEDAEQVTIFNQLRLNYPDLAKLATHIKNEGLKTKATAAKDAINGLNAGFSDIVIIGTPVFVCELKRADFTKSKASSDQQEFLINASNSGAFACIALGHKGFFLALQEWIKCTKMIKRGY